ncbi:response regulator transcription factor [Sutterella sp.]|uniref:response regulator transcription factor n=1 Tax=Sutterella sp. TaxID=1981025 RepID=UPI0026E018DF|nr:response regulator [Sutterella sp.]MDO5532681.1 response regulator [Sutterella sp.]
MRNLNPVVRLVDDDADFRSSQRLLLMTLGFEVREYESAQAFLDGDDRDRPGCILLDLRMPGMTGLEMQERLIELKNRIPVIMLTGHGDIGAAVRSMKLGAEDFLEKKSDPMVLCDTVRAACERSVAAARAEEAEAREQKRFGDLSPREREVIELVAGGLSNREAAEKLGLSVETVRMHRQHAYAKLGISSTLEAFRWVEAQKKQEAK